MYLSVHRIIDTFFKPINLKFDQSGSSPEIKLKNEAKNKHEDEREGIYCSYCKTKITHPSHAIEMQGTHHHVFTNPEGIDFEIGLYDQAECLAISPAMLEHTWFTGYAWQIVVCPECTSHLGWCYSKHGTPDFYGLIVARLKG